MEKKIMSKNKTAEWNNIIERLRAEPLIYIAKSNETKEPQLILLKCDNLTTDEIIIILHTAINMLLKNKKIHS